MLGNLSDNKDKDEKEKISRTTSLDMDFETNSLVSEGDQKDYRIPKVRSAEPVAEKKQSEKTPANLEKHNKNTTFWGNDYDYYSQYHNSDSDVEATRVPQRANTDIQRTEQEKQEQMNFGLQTTKVTRINRLKDNVRRWENIIEVLPFWRISYNPVNITLAIITAVFVAVYIFVNYTLLQQDQVILFYSQVDETRMIIPKPLLVLVPIVVVGFELIILRLQRLIFNFDRRLSHVIAFSQIFFNIMLIIAILQIISLMLN